MEPAIEPVILANSKFSIDLLKVFCKRNTDNVLFSPLSISSALGLVLLGAEGETADQMYKALHFGKMNIIYHDLYEALYKGGRNRSLKLVNRMFGESTLNFYDDFLDKCEEWCFASMRNIDFKTKPDAAREKINIWVKKNTGDQIENLLDQGGVSADTSLSLISLVHFKEDWGKSFTPVDTNKDNGVKWPMMNRNDDFYMGNIPHRQHLLPTEARILEIPYAKNDLSMLIILPNKKDGIQELVESITYEKLLEWTEPDNMTLFKNMDVEIPIFKLQVTYDLKDPLEALGIKDLFSDKCDLSGMGPGPFKNFIGMHISNVEVDKTGTEIWGGSGGEVKKKSFAQSYKSTESFVADHPFLFFIRHNPTKSIIFWGRFNPESDPQSRQ
ncbi:leukocyte elastase inhibitor-like [Megalobrama amblycephala]|uniref:leukocyte elastase inhibitor-like n=1 Tax=Megalobrama amblycephala TaxID=75352 RepID=UPI0020147D58|nr:leukocyte elastase inhibitor-like [Megalobrama amblycephala]